MKACLVKNKENARERERSKEQVLPPRLREREREWEYPKNTPPPPEMRSKLWRGHIYGSLPNREVTGVWHKWNLPGIVPTGCQGIPVMEKCLVGGTQLELPEWVQESHWLLMLLTTVLTRDPAREPTSGAGARCGEAACAADVRCWKMLQGTCWGHTRTRGEKPLPPPAPCTDRS